MRITREMIDIVLNAAEGGRCQDAYKALAALALGKCGKEVTMEERAEAKNQAFLYCYSYEERRAIGESPDLIKDLRRGLDVDFSVIEARLMAYFGMRKKTS